MITILYSGRSTNSTNRVWGYIRDEHQNKISWRDSYFTFWGHKDGKLFFQQCKNDRIFHKAKSKKIKRYEPYKMEDQINSEFGQYKLVRKLRYGS